ncbi:MAG: hypothetical protein ACRD2S_08440, partial [Terriglobales bacterium]
AREKDLVNERTNLVLSKASNVPKCRITAAFFFSSVRPGTETLVAEHCVEDARTAHNRSPSSLKIGKIVL